MKILSLKFKNINSLLGENEIDFTNPLFTNDGLFAITGKTGAGKSSILDAISLAIYGKTPRVDITEKENPVMTRGELDCYSEIVFEVAGKKWKSSWKQRRTRTGTLSPVNRIIADFEGKIIADKVTNCKLEIVKIIGLSFEQFTKVIMLAQGSFAAFLQADKNEKGALLEQITGTEIYAEISKTVYDRNAQEEEKLKNIIRQIAAIKILTEEEIKKLTDEVLLLKVEKNKIESELQIIEKSKKWLENIDDLNIKIKEAHEKLPKLELNSKTANENYEVAQKQLNQVKAELEKQTPIFIKVRELDTMLFEKNNQLHPILTAISELNDSITIKNELLEAEKQKETNAQNLLNEKTVWAQENKKLEELVTKYSAIEQENQLIVNNSNEVKNLNSEIDTLQKDFAIKENNVAKTLESFNEKTKNLAIKTNEVEKEKAKLLDTLGGKELSKLQIEKENLSNFNTHIKTLIDTEIAISNNKNEIKSCDEKLNQFEKSKSETTKNIEADTNIIKNLEEKINLLEENIKLTQTIRSLDEHRHNLRDGQECPLCGSLEHPFAIGNVPEIGEKQIELDSLKKQNKKIVETIQQNTSKLASLLSNNENTLKNKTKELQALQKNESKQKEILKEIQSLNIKFVIPTGEDTIEKLKEIQRQMQIEYSQLVLILDKVSEIESKIASLHDKEIPQLQAEKELADKDQKEAQTNLKLSAEGIRIKQESLNNLKEKFSKENQAFLLKLNSYNVDNLVALKKLHDAWIDNKNSIDELTSQITKVSSNIALINNELKGLTDSFKEKEKDSVAVKKEIQILLEKRNKIFGEKSVTTEENILKQLIIESEAKKTEAETKKNNTKTEVEKNKAIVKEKEKELLTYKEQKITEKSIIQLKEEYDEKKLQSDQYLITIGANEQLLESNAQNVKNNLSKLKEKDKQQLISNKWDVLSELIGSKDGKKYRNFVQSLTFEHLIVLSNRQLQKMSERYLIKRTGDSTNPFELSVIDKFQNSEERTAQNLSGGEKFILSLSLALGLSSMASKNMQIDTMFIDEGFGTLDSDYLDVALNALSNLKSEGKVIGVISHLTELKERIATHVEVVSGGNGHSKIKISN